MLGAWMVKYTTKKVSILHLEHVQIHNLTDILNSSLTFASSIFSFSVEDMLSGWKYCTSIVEVLGLISIILVVKLLKQFNHNNTGIGCLINTRIQALTFRSAKIGRASWRERV